MKQIEKGLEYASKTIVTDKITAREMGSGDMPVLATPAMVALMENAAMMAVAGMLDEGETTVGSMVNTTHLRPSAVGAEISAKATLIDVDGRKLTYHVIAMDGDNVIGEGEHIRFIVDRDRFMKKIKL